MTYIDHRDIVDKINADFEKVYKGVRMSGVIFGECMKAVNNVSLMKNIIEQNNKGTPPVKTFLDSSSALTGGFSSYEKSCIGAFWGFIFQFVFNYKDKIKGVEIETKDIKTASLYKNPVDDITVY